MRPGRVQFRAHQHRAPDLGQDRDSGGGEHSLDAGQLLAGVSGEQMVERQHRVGLAAAEVGLQVDHRVATGTGQPLDRSDEKLFEPMR